LCAIYSQLHKHKAALEQAEISAQISHNIIQGKIALLTYLIKKTAIERELAEEVPANMSLANELSFYN
jgi:hypothetical protein